jgi:endoribonuclease Dicer
LKLLKETDEKPNAKLWQKISKKSVADSVEALFGLYLTLHGIKGALKVMRWMGVNVPDPSGDEGSSSSSSSFGGTPPEPLLLDSPQAQHLLDDHLAGFETLESSLNFRFGNRFYLLQAFSHASYHHNRMTSCYQRLEFLGDAVFGELDVLELLRDFIIIIMFLIVRVKVEHFGFDVSSQTI